MELNGSPPIELYTELGEINAKFEVIVANIIAPTLIQLKEEMMSRLEAGGTLLLSGITTEETPLIETAFKKLSVINKINKNEWWGYELRRLDS